jgi:hypothetical protein
MAMSNAELIQWSVAEAAMDCWSQRIFQRAVALAAGTPAATGQPSASNYSCIVFNRATPKTRLNTARTSGHSRRNMPESGAP